MKLIWSLLMLLMFSGKSFSYPMKDIYLHLDITSFDSTLKPMIINTEKRLPEFKGLPAPIINENTIIIDDSDWVYKLVVIKQTGEDYDVCFIDQAKQASYSTQHSMVLRKYAQDYVAIQSQSDACNEYVE